MNNKQSQNPAVGIALLLTHKNRVLIGKRLKQPMLQSWQLPGGWIRYEESPENTVSRKISEFPGLKGSAAKLITYTNNQFENGFHSISLYFQAECLNAEAIDLNKNKHCSDWSWVHWYDLPEPLFLPLMLLKQTGFEPFIR
jgi:ADP-ribose pyrophosphatase YjhB (NUDIX family)